MLKGYYRIKKVKEIEIQGFCEIAIVICGVAW
jgi:hypothetical protein